jgi:putative spermidine/putrescine transport system substrate-binding protein
MINRRQFLISSSILILNQLISGCSNNNNKSEIISLEGTIPAQLLGKFRKAIDQEKNLILKPAVNLQNIFELLQTWQNKNSNNNNENTFSLPLGDQKETKQADLVTLGDFWLKEAIIQQLIEPLDLETLANWHNLPSKWQQLVKRNTQGDLDQNGLIWGAPYRWGSVMIAYREDKFKKLGWYPQDWEDLWKPEIKGYLSLLQQPQEIIGLTLKKLGYSYNTENLTQIPNLKEELIKLHNNVKFYASTNYLQPLILGDTWIAVGWSNDILPVTKNNPNIKAVIPKSGTSLWADLWVKPKSNNQNLPNIINQWINFCWQTNSAKEIGLYSNASSPVILGMNPEEIPKDILKNSLLYPEPDILEKSEFLLPITPQIREEYEYLIKYIAMEK